MIIWGQSVSLTDRFKKAIDRFCECFNVTILTDKISNLHHPKAIYNVPAILSSLRWEDKANLIPDIVISIGGNYIFNNEIKALLRPAKIPHWQVGYEDKVCDPFRTLTEIFEMGEAFFLNNYHLQALLHIRMIMKKLGRKYLAKFRYQQQNVENYMPSVGF